MLKHAAQPLPIYGTAVRLRLGEQDVVEAVAAVRSWFAKRGRTEFIWFVGDSAAPPGLRDRLLELGAEPDPLEPVLAGMLLTQPPPPTEGIETRPIETFDEYAALTEIAWESFEVDEEEREGLRHIRPQRWEEYRASDDTVTFGAFVGGEPVAEASVVFTPLGGLLLAGSTRPDMRGRGAYRALVRARWDAAVARGAPALAVQAGAQSRPILERLGFRQVATVHALLDRTAASG